MFALDCLIFSFESGWGARWKRRSAPCQGRWCGVSHPLGSSQGPRHSPTVGSTAGSCLSGTRYLYTHHCRGTLQLSFGSFRFFELPSWSGIGIGWARTMDAKKRSMPTPDVRGVSGTASERTGNNLSSFALESQGRNLVLTVLHVP